MKIPQIESFIKNLPQNNTTNVVLLYGTDENLILEKVHEIKAQLKDYIFTIIEPETDYISYLTNEVLTSSMFGEKKLIHLHNFRKLDGKKITDFLSRIHNDCQNVVILSHPTSIEATNSIRKMCETEKHFASVGIYPESGVAVKQVAVQILQDLKIDFEPTVPEVLSQMFAGNSSTLKQELYKLSLYMLSNPQKVTTQLVTMVINGSTQENIFDIPPLLFNKNLGKALQVIESAQVQDESPVVVFTAISLYIKKLYAIKKELSKPNAISIEILLKKHGVFFNQVADFKKHLAMISNKNLSIILGNLNNLEIATRFSTKTAYNCIKNFAVNLCCGF